MLYMLYLVGGSLQFPSIGRNSGHVTVCVETWKNEGKCKGMALHGGLPASSGITKSHDIPQCTILLSLDHNEQEKQKDACMPLHGWFWWSPLLEIYLSGDEKLHCWYVKSFTRLHNIIITSLGNGRNMQMERWLSEILDSIMGAPCNAVISSEMIFMCYSRNPEYCLLSEERNPAQTKFWRPLPPSPCHETWESHYRKFRHVICFLYNLWCITSVPRSTASQLTGWRDWGIAREHRSRDLIYGPRFEPRISRKICSIFFVINVRNHRVVFTPKNLHAKQINRILV